MKKPELLAPAGSFEKAKVAFMYGADAVYCGTASLSLRSRAEVDDDDLEKTIKSILEQTYNNYELILIDNGSTDNSAEICKKYQEKDKRVKFYIQSKKGVSNARNMGIEKATGEFICFVDSDDYIEKDMLNSYMDIYIKYKPDLIVSGFFSEVEDIDGKVQMDEIYCDDKNYPNIEEIKKDFVTLWDKHLLYNIWNKMYKREIIEKHNIKFLLLQSMVQIRLS